MQYIKALQARTLLWFLGRGICACALRDTRAQAEVRDWAEGVRVALRVAPAGPAMVLEKRNGRLHFLGTRLEQAVDSPGARPGGTADLLITFKHLDGALPILMGMKSVAQGYAERRMTMAGDLTFAMSVVRVMLLVEAYLFPELITRRIMQRIPAREVSMLRIYLSTLLGS